jgi:hypothetical protein
LVGACYEQNCMKISLRNDFLRNLLIDISTESNIITLPIKDENVITNLIYKEWYLMYNINCH